MEIVKTNKSRSLSDLARSLGVIVFFAALYLTSLYSYLLFHTLAELITIVIGCTLFMLAWNFRRFYKDSFLIFIGTAYFFCSFIDLLHTLSYKGMTIFQGYDANLPTQLWIAARYLQSAALLISPLFLQRKARIGRIVSGLLLVTLLLLLSIFAWGVFPACYIEGVGLTPFKITSEYIIDLVLVMAILRLYQNRRLMDRKVLKWIILSIGITGVSELAFTFYLDVYGISNLIGHMARIVAYYLVYKALIETEAGLIYTDMTQLQNTESALRASELQAQRSLAELQSIYSNTPVGLCFFDINLRYQAINDNLARVNRLPASAHIGKSLREVLHGPIAGQIEQCLSQTLETRQPVLNQLLAGAVDPSTAYSSKWLASFHPVFWNGGQLLGVSCVVQDVTEQIQAKETLQSSEQNLKLFIEYAPTAIAMFDRDMRYIAASQRYLIDYRIKEQNIIGRSHYEVFPDIPDRWKEIHRRCLAGAVEKADEEPFTRADGTLDWVHWEIRPWYDVQGEIGGIILFSEVITERKQAQDALRESEATLRRSESTLRESEERFRALIDEAPIAIAISRDSKFLYVNPAYLAMHGIDRADELIGLPIFGRVAPESQEQSRERADRRRQGLPVDKNYEYIALRKDGTHLPTIAAVTRVKLIDGPATIGFFQDITALKQAEDELRKNEATLRESEQRFRSVVESNIVGVVFADPDTGLVNDANDEFLRIIGRSRPELEAGEINWRAITSPEELEREEQARFNTPPGQHRAPYEKEYIRPDGSPAPVIIGGSYLDEERHRVVAFVLDNAERKRVENELARTHSALQDYTERLMQSNKELEEFAFVASHDLQEPLRKIKMFGMKLQRLLGEVVLNDISVDAADTLHRMESAADRMQKMIDGLLELSRINTRGGSFEPVELRLVVEEAVNDLEARIQATGGRVIVGELYSAEVDVLQIRRLFQNLIGNALKFHKPEVPPLIEVSGILNRSREGSSVVIAVKDNGIGFEEQYAQRNFQPFQRLHGKSEYEGTGLGLSIVQKIVERHHGRIEAHSQPGEGSVFQITLPVAGTGML